ncbi:hypothetical protein ACQK5W_02290 [Pantoea sp. FN060301]|uniref:hypothetical protein n=1 Tax=Pantoea sp. FN060301 TaxID=3420380 RepID=UPI003D1688B3
MNKKPLKKSTRLFIPLNVVTGILLGVAVVLSGCIYSSPVSAASLKSVPASSLTSHELEASGRWQPLDTHAHVIVYRKDNNASLSSKRVLNVFINNQYHTSVLPQTRAVELFLCPGKKSVNVSLSQLDKYRHAQPGNVTVVSPTLQSGERYYYQVSLNDRGAITTRLVPETIAKSELMGLEPEQRTLSRVLRETSCPEVIYSIDTKKLFTSKENPTSLSAEGNSMLAALVSTIENEFDEIDKVIVNSSNDINEKITITHPLSQMRANSVATWLVNSHFPSPEFIAQGKDLNNCLTHSASQREHEACLDFKRSVAVEVYGIRKVPRPSF